MSGPIVLVEAAALRELVAEVVREAIADARSAEPALLDRAELARRLAVSPSTVDRMRGQGCPVVRVGDAPRFELGAVLAWLRARGGEQ